MSAVGPLSNFFVGQTFVERAVSRNIGVISGRSLHVLSTQTLGNEDAETESFARRALNISLVILQRIWYFIKCFCIITVQLVVILAQS